MIVRWVCTLVVFVVLAAYCRLLEIGLEEKFNILHYGEAVEIAGFCWVWIFLLQRVFQEHRRSCNERKTPNVGIDGDCEKEYAATENGAKRPRPRRLILLGFGFVGLGFLLLGLWYLVLLPVFVALFIPGAFLLGLIALILTFERLI